MKTINQFLLEHPENDTLPALLVFVPGGNVEKFKSCAQLRNFPPYNQFRFINGACQLDLDGESTFVIIYCQKE